LRRLVTEPPPNLVDAWDAQADAWAQFARRPGHDWAHQRLNFPPFLELLPPPGRRTLDLGCGEGRVGAELERRGHHVVGVDASPRMVALARELHEAVVADAAGLPFDDGAFDLIVAYMSLMNMADIPAAVRETARVLEPGGRFCISVLHPITAAGEWLDKDDLDSPFVIRGSYFNGPTKVWESDRDGIRMTFYDRRIPLSTYTGALEDAGLWIDALREPVPGDEIIREMPAVARLRRVPLFLHLRAVKP
jgi:SAM-dependent methyltransferase